MNKNYSEFELLATVNKIASSITFKPITVDTCCDAINDIRKSGIDIDVHLGSTLSYVIKQNSDKLNQQFVNSVKEKQLTLTEGQLLSMIAIIISRIDPEFINQNINYNIKKAINCIGINISDNICNEITTLVNSTNIWLHNKTQEKLCEMEENFVQGCE